MFSGSCQALSQNSFYSIQQFFLATHAAVPIVSLVGGEGEPDAFRLSGNRVRPFDGFFLWVRTRRKRQRVARLGREGNTLARSFFQLKCRFFLHMETVTNAAVAALITVNGPAFAVWRKAHAAATAARKEADTLREACGFPSTESLVVMLGIAQGGKASATVADGNGKPVGKVSVYWKDAFEMPAGFSSRVS